MKKMILGLALLMNQSATDAQTENSPLAREFEENLGAYKVNNVYTDKNRRDIEASLLDKNGQAQGYLLVSGNESGNDGQIDTKEAFTIIVAKRDGIGYVDLVSMNKKDGKWSGTSYMTDDRNMGENFNFSSFLESDWVGKKKHKVDPAKPLYMPEFQGPK